VRDATFEPLTIYFKMIGITLSKRKKTFAFLLSFQL